MARRGTKRPAKKRLSVEVDPERKDDETREVSLPNFIMYLYIGNKCRVPGQRA